MCNYRGRSRDFEKGATLCQKNWPEKNFLGFKWSKKAENNVRNYKFLAKYFYQYFKIFLIFIDKILSIFQNLLTH